MGVSQAQGRHLPLGAGFTRSTRICGSSGLQPCAQLRASESRAIPSKGEISWDLPSPGKQRLQAREEGRKGIRLRMWPSPRLPTGRPDVSVAAAPTPQQGTEGERHPCRGLQVPHSYRPLLANQTLCPAAPSSHREARLPRRRGVLLTQWPWARGCPGQAVHQDPEATSRPVQEGGGPVFSDAGPAPEGRAATTCRPGQASWSCLSACSSGLRDAGLARCPRGHRFSGATDMGLGVELRDL